MMQTTAAMGRAVLVACCLHAVGVAALTSRSQNFLAPVNVKSMVTLNVPDERRVRGVCMMLVCALHDFPWTGCIKTCQTAMSSCLASKGLEKYSECEVEVPKTLENVTSSGQWLARKQDVPGSAATRNATILMLQQIEDECVSACGHDVDSSCPTECQVRMYTCLDYDRSVPEGKKKYQACFSDTIAAYKKFAADWNATHPYFLTFGRQTSASELERVADKCGSACGEGVDSSCVPECQVKMYMCLDHDQKTKDGALKYQECETAVIKTYQAFAEHWNATHPYLLSHSYYRLKAVDADNIYEGCESACSKDADSSCVTACQVQMYSCFAFNRATEEGATKHKACVDRQIAFYTKFVKEGNATQSYFIAEWRPKGSQHATLVELHQIRDQCTSSCGIGVDSSCVVECQVQMYTCLDHDRKTPEGASKYKNCTQEVIAKYNQFAADWDASHPYLLSLGKHADAVALEAVHTGCIDACGDGVDSSCVPECQVRMYRCLDHDLKTEEGSVKYKKCEQEVLAKYEDFADDWDATHPYLLAIHKHASAIQLEAIQGDCRTACGKEVDSSCVPECQVQTYTCLDHDQKVPEGAKKYKACKEAVIEKYQNFSADWDAVHPY